MVRYSMADDWQGRIPEVTLECMRHLRKHFAAVKISVEVEKPTRTGLQDLAAEADVIFYSKSWALVCSSHPWNNLLTLRMSLA